MSKFELKVENISFERGGRQILDGISLCINRGEIIGIIGSNGAGKTTFLKTLNNLNEISSGKITFNGEDISQMDSKILARHISFMNQNTNIGFDFPCLDVVTLGRYPYLEKFEEYSKSDREIAKKYMEVTNTLKFKDKSILSLSGGERQRVLFAKTLTQDTDIILLDEPTASLDMKYEEEIFKILKGLKKDKAIVTIIHNLRTAIKYCDRLLLLKNGKILGIGTPEEIISDKNLKELYGMEIKVYRNELNGRLDFCID